MKKIIVLVLILVFSSCTHHSHNNKTNSWTVNTDNSQTTKNNETSSWKVEKIEKKEEIKDIDLEKEKYYDEVDNIFEVLNSNK